MLKYKIKGTSIIIHDDAIKIFIENKQKHFFQFETGGQLFGYKKNNEYNICKATKSSLIDKNSKFSFCPNIISDQSEIDFFYENGYDFLGNWHAHPQKVPTPSFIDRITMIDRYKKSKHRLNFYLLIIVGQNEFPLGLSVNIVNSKILEAEIDE